MIRISSSRRAASATALALGIAALLPLSANAATTRTATITGTVVDSSGKPVAGEKVGYLDFNFDESATTVTAADGTYTLKGVIPGKIWMRFLTSASLLGQFNGGATKLEKAKPMTVKAGQTVTGIDAALKPAGYVSGTVTASTTKAAVAGVPVAISWESASLPDSYLYADEMLPHATTNATGAYTIGGVPGGSYRISFADALDAAPLGGSNYGGWWIRRLSAKTYAVKAGATTSGVNAAVAPGGRLSGTVRSKSGKPVAGATVVIVPGSGVPYPDEIVIANTDSKGRFSLGAFAAGRHTWTFSVDLPTSNKDIGGKRTVSITVGKTTTGVDFRAR